MKFLTRHRVRTVAMLVLATFLATTCTGLGAQDSEVKRQATTIKKKTRTITAVAVDPVAQLTADIEQCGLPCRVGAANDIAAPGGGTLDYDCNEDGDCACFGAKDCVAMTDVCKEGTMGCNKQGCVCEKDTGDGG